MSDNDHPHTEEIRAKATRWFGDAKFGMFIHWGVYSVLGDGEWVMNNPRHHGHSVGGGRDSVDTIIVLEIGRHDTIGKSEDHAHVQRRPVLETIACACATGRPIYPLSPSSLSPLLSSRRLNTHIIQCSADFAF
jgi:hypothetical protein